MRDIGCKLLSTTSKADDIGVQKNVVKTTETEIPILKVYANEYYRANEQGYKPSLRLRISTLNYDNQKELIYMNNKYSIIRTQEVTVDELILICERKIKNVQKH